MSQRQTLENGDLPLLDLFSTSQTSINNGHAKCHKNAPYICIPGERSDARLYQSCCNDWLCPRCGEKRAKHEYGRIVEGARKLAKERPLYMMTVTCKGRETVDEAEREYLNRTNRLHANISAYSRRELGEKTEYAAVVERQDRGHPHTHYLTTFKPRDTYFITDEYERYCADVQTLNCVLPPEMRFSPEKLEDIDNRQMFSTWLCQAAVYAGLGVQVRVAICDTIEGASRYIAKYLFKSLTAVKFPKNWRRVRYSRGWPKLPEPEATSAFAVMSAHDWQMVARLGNVECYGKDVFQRALNWQVYKAYYKTADGEIIDPSNHEVN